MNGSVPFSTDHDVDLQRVQESNLPSIIKEELEKFLTWDFDCSRFQNKQLFKILERAVLSEVMGTLIGLRLTEESLNEVRTRYSEIGDYLFDQRYRLLDITFLATLYMRVIQSLVYSSERGCRATCWYAILPRLTQFHVTYFEQLVLEKGDSYQQAFL